MSPVSRFRARAFTLIELLVVVSIIALLVAILLPSLGKAKRLALRTTCLANLRQAAIATHTYANGNDDQIPEVSGAAGSGNFSQALLSVYTASSASPTDPGYGFGRLYSTHYITDLRIAWCPEQQDTGFNLTPSNVVLPWPSAYGSIKYRSSYNYNANHIGNNVAYKKLSRIPQTVSPSAAYAGQGEFLANDVIQNAGYIAHVDGHSAYWNAVFADGHATSIRAEGVYSQLQAWVTNAATGAGGVGSSWPRFDQLTNILITNVANNQTAN